MNQLNLFIELTRLKKPIGYMLLFWPCAWGLTLAYDFNKNLKCIARAGAGFNNIPVELATKNGIVVFNTPGANSNAVKELVICGMLLSSRGIIQGNAFAKSLIGKDETEINNLNYSLLSTPYFSEKNINGDLFVDLKVLNDQLKDI